MDDFEKLINASDLIEWIMETYPDWCVGDVRSIVDHVIDLPSAEPRPRGKWIDEGFYADGHGAHAFRCSECGGHIIEYDEDPFCRWCGADMRGKADDT